jgi:hypothetical protein
MGWPSFDLSMGSGGLYIGSVGFGLCWALAGLAMNCAGNGPSWPCHDLICLRPVLASYGHSLVLVWAVLAIGRAGLVMVLTGPGLCCPWYAMDMCWLGQVKVWSGHVVVWPCAALARAGLTEGWAAHWLVWTLSGLDKGWTGFGLVWLWK